MQAEHGYVMKAFPTEQRVWKVGRDLDLAFLNQHPVDPKQLAEHVVDGRIPKGWRVLKFRVRGSRVP